MAAIYINYPNPHIEVHHDAQCGFTKRDGTSKRKKKVESALDGIRLIRAIEAKKIKFRAVAGLNGLWVVTSDEEARGLAREIAPSMRSTYRVTPAFPVREHC